MKDRQRWQPEEDALLRAYVKQYGPKEWSLLSHRMGKTLDRDPKSCLERWKNYLKPGIKKGTLTPEEQTLVVSLQEKYGNKWKKIAAEVPGRTAKRLGKWWEVFKEKQQKQIHKTQKLNFSDPAPISVAGSPEEALKGSYDHILETFAEKYVRVRPKPFQFPIEPPPVLPPWMTGQPSSSSSPPSPSVSLTLSPSEPVVVDPEIAPPNQFFSPAPVLHVGAPVQLSPSEPVQPEISALNRFFSPGPVLQVGALTQLSPSEQAFEPVQPEFALPNRFFSPGPVLQVGGLVQYCREVEEANQSWVLQKKEATWRLNRLEQQLEAEKARKRREKTEEFEARIRRLREEEMASLSRIEMEYREEMIRMQREDESKEAKLMEDLISKQEKMMKIVERIGLHGLHHLQ